MAEPGVIFAYLDRRLSHCSLCLLHAPVLPKDAGMFWEAGTSHREGRGGPAKMLGVSILSRINRK